MQTIVEKSQDQKNEDKCIEMIETFTNGNIRIFWNYATALNRKGLLQLITVWVELFDSTIHTIYPLFYDDIAHLSNEDLRHVLTILKLKDYNSEFCVMNFRAK